MPSKEAKRVKELRLLRRRTVKRLQRAKKSGNMDKYMTETMRGLPAKSKLRQAKFDKTVKKLTPEGRKAYDKMGKTVSTWQKGGESNIAKLTPEKAKKLKLRAARRAMRLQEARDRRKLRPASGVSGGGGGMGYRGANRKKR